MRKSLPLITLFAAMVVTSNCNLPGTLTQPAVFTLPLATITLQRAFFLP